nr:PREDICTED: protein FAM19A5 [Equus przewalskii]
MPVRGQGCIVDSRERRVEEVQCQPVSSLDLGSGRWRRGSRPGLCYGLGCWRGLGQLAAGTCEIVTLDRDSSQPRRTIARQTARCACRKGQIAGTTRARPACVDARIIRTKQWCDMLPCLEGEGCDLLINRSGWTCTQPGGRIKTTTVS